MSKHWSEEELKIREVIAEQAALLTLRGIGINEQVKNLKQYDLLLTRTQLVTLKKHPKYKEVIKSEAVEMVESGQMKLKTGASELVDEVLRCLRSKVQEGDVKAAIAVINILIDKTDDEGPKQAQQINVIMPGASKTKEVKDVTDS